MIKVTYSFRFTPYSKAHIIKSLFFETHEDLFTNPPYEWFENLPFIEKSFCIIT